MELKWNMDGWLFSLLASYMHMGEIEMNITPCSWAGGAQGYKHYCVWSHLHLTSCFLNHIILCKVLFSS